MIRFVDAKELQYFGVLIFAAIFIICIQCVLHPTKVGYLVDFGRIIHRPIFSFGNFRFFQKA